MAAVHLLRYGSPTTAMYAAKVSRHVVEPSSLTAAASATATSCVETDSPFSVLRLP
jgi:hypothetical protein